MYKENDRGELMFLIDALLTWLIVGVFLCLSLSFIVTRTTLDSSFIAYLSSSVSFLSASFAGLRSAAESKYNKLYSTLITAVFTIISVLTVAYIVSNGQISASGLISVISFTFSGFLFGGLVLHTICYGNRKKAYKRNRKRTKLT